MLGLGGWLTYGSENGVQEVEQTAACLQEAWNHGINFFDTAEVYADGQSEVIMGRALRLCNFERDDYVISTKLFFGDGKWFPLVNGGDKADINRTSIPKQPGPVAKAYCRRNETVSQETWPGLG